METIAIFNKFFKKSAREPTREQRKLEASLTDDRRIEETGSSHIELSNPVAPASGVEKTHPIQNENHGAHKRMHSLFIMKRMH